MIKRQTSSLQLIIFLDLYFSSIKSVKGIDLQPFI